MTTVEAIIIEIKNAGISAEQVTVNKNGIERIGIMLGEGKIRPTLYPDLESLHTVEDISDCAMRLIKMYKEHKAPNDIENVTEMFKNWDIAKNYIVPCLMKANDDIRVTTPYLDLNVYYRFVYKEVSIVINKEHLKFYGISVEQLHKVAVDNLRKQITVRHMIDVLKEMGDVPSDLLGNVNMYVVSVESNQYGAAALLFPDVFSTIKSKMGKDIMIIPSSIHELIVVPKDDESEINKMIVEVNRTTVSADEVLNDHVYFLDTQITY